MKKKLASLIIVFSLMAATIAGGTVMAFAGTFEEECDIVFRNALKDVADAEGLQTDAFDIRREPLYDINLDQLGYCYYIDAGATDGYALAICNDGIFDVTEIYLDALDPFGGYSGKRVYVNLLMYLVYADGEYIEPSSDLALGNDVLAESREKALYADTDPATSWIETTVHFTERTETGHELALVYPSLLPSGNKTSCVPTTGANIIYYYDRFFPNLIPNFNPGRQIGDLYMYNGNTTETQNLAETLYDYMGTVEGGTTIDGFKSGMISYVTEKGYVVSFNSCMAMNRFLYSSAKNYLNNDKPLALFLSVFNVMTDQPHENYDYLQTYVCEGAHAMAAFGYKEVTYTLESGTRVDRYLAVASGIAGHERGYFNVLYYATIDDVYAVNIS